MDKFIPDNDLNTDNSWLEYAIMKYEDEEDKFFENIPLKSNSQLKWINLDHLLEKMNSDNDIERNLRKLS